MPVLLPFPVVDSHVHFWDPGRLDYPWLASVPPIAETHLPNDYWKEAHAIPVGQVIFVEAACAASFAVRENDWALALAAEDSRIAAIVAQVPLDAGEETGRLLKLMAARPLVRGVRHIIQGTTDPDFCLRPVFLEGLRLLADLNLTFDICVHHSQLPSVIRMVDQCPDVRFILDHVGKPAIRDSLMEPWKTHLHELAARPHVCCKVSGLLTEAKMQGWQSGDFRPYLSEALAAFGTDRLIFGSDWPVCRLAGSIEDWISILLSFFNETAPQALAKIFGENARAFYRIPGSSP